MSPMSDAARDDAPSAYDRLTCPRMFFSWPEPREMHTYNIGNHTVTREQYYAYEAAPDA